MLGFPLAFLHSRKLQICHARLLYVHLIRGDWRDEFSLRFLRLGTAVEKNHVDTHFSPCGRGGWTYLAVFMQLQFGTLRDPESFHVFRKLWLRLFCLKMQVIPRSICLLLEGASSLVKIHRFLYLHLCCKNDNVISLFLLHTASQYRCR